MFRWRNWKKRVPPAVAPSAVRPALTDGRGEGWVEGVPRTVPINYADSQLSCIVHSPTEDARARKVKETWTAEWVVNLPEGAVLYDIGANIGIFALLAAERREKNVRVLAFEPALTNFPSLVTNVLHNGLPDRVVPVCAGFGATSCMMDFRYRSMEAGSALHSFGRLPEFKPGRPVDPVQVWPALCYRLDDWIRLPGVPFPSHIKIDVDGEERAIVEGAVEVLSDPRVQEVQIELFDMDEQDRNSADIVARMERFGYKLASVHNHTKTFPLGRDFRFRRVRGSPERMPGRQGVMDCGDTGS